MEKQTVDVRFDMTICTDEETRSYLKVGVTANGIIVSEDVLAQAKAAEQAAIVVMGVLNEGLQEEVASAIVVVKNPAMMSDQMKEMDDRLERTERLLGRAVLKIKELMADKETAALPPSAAEVKASVAASAKKAKLKAAKPKASA